MKIIKLTAENVKRLKAIEITPEGHVVEITGRNEQGKTSVLDSIWMALGGAEAAKGTKRPIRVGEKTARVVLDLEKIIVTRTWTDKGSYLKVETLDGAEYKSPQALLDKLVGRLSFDPLAFSNLDDKARREALLGLVKLDLDLDDWAKSRRAVYDERTLVNRKVTDLGVTLRAYGEFPADLPAEEISTATILAEQRAAQDKNAANAEEWRRLKLIENDVSNVRHAIAERAGEIAELEKKLAATKELQAKAEATLKLNEKRARDLRKVVEGLQDVDLAQFEAKLQDLERLNEEIRARRTRDNVAARLNEAKLEAQALTEKLEALDLKKTTVIEAAKFPIEGLGLEDEGVTYKGIPFSQCSSAERLRVSLAIAMALNPKLRVLRIVDGSLLDSHNLAVIREMVEANDFQLWIERVSDDGGVGVVIEDGMVKA